MAGNFNVSGIVKLVDDFSSKARAIAAATDQMSHRMTAFQQRAAGLRSALVGLGAAFAGAFTFHKFKDALREAASEEAGIRRFEHMFESFKNIIGVGQKELTEKFEEFGKMAAADPDLIMAETADKFMKGGRLVGKNLMRAITTSMNMAALYGGSEEDIKNAFGKIAGILVRPRGAVMRAQAEGLINPEDAKAIQQLAKHSANTAHIQDRMLTALEKRYRGGMAKMFKSPSYTLAMMVKAPKEFMSGVGRLLNPVVADTIHDIASAVIDWGDSMVHVSKRLNSITSQEEKLRALWQSFRSAPPAIHALAGVLSVTMAMLAAFAIKALIASLPIILMATALGLAAALAMDFDGTINTLSAGFDSLDSSGKALAITVGIVSAAFVAWKVGSIIASLAALAVATWAAAGPWILLAAAILIVAGLIYIFRDSISAAFSGLGDIISKVWTGMKDGAQVAIDYIVNIYTSAVGKLKELFLGLKNIFLGIGDNISAAGSWVGGKLGITQGPSTLPAAGAKASVEGQVNINIKDPGNNASISSSSNGNIPVNVGQTRGGSYRSTVPSSMVPGPR